MIRPEADHRSPERRALDEQIASEPRLPPLGVASDAVRTTLETYLKSRRTRRFKVRESGRPQMIGGTDVVIAGIDDASVLDVCARIIQRCWPAARFEDAVTGTEFETYSQIPMGRVRELLIYRSREVKDEWDAGDVDVPPNTMLYLIRSRKAITVALDDATVEETRSLIHSLRAGLQMDILNTYAEAA
jgi:hypothetical protein